MILMILFMIKKILTISFSIGKISLKSILVIAIAVCVSCDKSNNDTNNDGTIGGKHGTLTWSLIEGTLTISGRGTMLEDVPWDTYRSAIETVIIESGVTSICNDAFSQCQNLTLVRIPDGIISIGNYAFSGCYNLTEIALPNTLINIGEFTFAHTNIKNIMIPRSVIIIGKSAFSSCVRLTSITIPSSVVTIAAYVFSSCTSLSSITIPNSVTFIGTSAFEFCSSLKTLNLPESITYIENMAFCFSGLTSFRFPDGVKNCGSLTFQDCKNLISIDLNNVEIIGALAFAGCSNLRTTTMSKVTKIRGFDDCISLSTIYCKNPIPPDFALSSVFPSNIYYSATVYVPASAIQAYKEDYYWSKFRNIRTITE
jgi:hypothetical protein